jgi:hypothetical protein
MYNDPKRPNCNLRLPLWQLVRASTAAPTYFPPEVIDIGGKPFAFVDGGITPYNMPAFAMFRMATAPPFGLEWETGEDRMMILSIGTGIVEVDSLPAIAPDRTLLSAAASIPSEMMNGMAYDQDINCRVVGWCTFGPVLDKEVGTLVPITSPKIGHGRAFVYARYNPTLTKSSLTELGLSAVDPSQISKLDSVGAIGDLLQIGRNYGSRVVDLNSHFPGFVRSSGLGDES